MTFSIIAHCRQTGQFGIAIASSSPAVASRCAHARAGVGAVASQNITDPALGTLLLDAMSEGHGAKQAMAAITTSRPNVHFRQLMAVDVSGQTATFMGSGILGTWGLATGEHCVASGNLLASDRVPAAMVQAFETTPGDLTDRLMRALSEGLREGGEAGPVRSAGIKVADRLSWPSVDLRVDWSDTPIEELALLWAIYRPQVEAYIQRAESPDASPRFGVPGDL